MTDRRDLVRTTVEDGVAVLTLDNPPLNLVTLELTRRLDAALERLASEPAARVLVVTGAGTRAFCAGSDVSEFPAVQDDVVRKKLAAENAAYSRLDDFPKPTIAALNGLAYGGGLELAVCCDILIAGADVRLALPEVKLGVLPGSGGTVRVPRRVGEGRAKELMFTGDPIDAQTACRYGLVHRVVPRERLYPEAEALARKLLSQPPEALRLAKRAVIEGIEMPLAQGLALESRLAATLRSARTS